MFGRPNYLVYFCVFVLWCVIILFNVHLFIVKLVKITFLFIICYWFYIPVNKDYQLRCLLSSFLVYFLLCCCAVRLYNHREWRWIQLYSGSKCGDPYTAGRRWHKDVLTEGGHVGARPLPGIQRGRPIVQSQAGRRERKERWAEYSAVATNRCIFHHAHAPETARLDVSAKRAAEDHFSIRRRTAEGATRRSLIFIDTYKPRWTGRCWSAIVAPLTTHLSQSWRRWSEAEHNFGADCRRFRERLGRMPAARRNN